jgi:pyridoxamine 5'-phosphate oxidase
MKLNRESLNFCPYRQFESWFQAATDTATEEPNAMSLATASGSGVPSLRTVLLKYWDERGFVFFTNYGSRKARQISENPHVALLFYWEPHRQVKIEGTADRISTAESLKYFALRPRGSQLGAWCSAQSSAISSRAILDAKLAEIKQKFQQKEVAIESRLFDSSFGREERIDCMIDSSTSPRAALPGRFKDWSHDRVV